MAMGRKQKEDFGMYEYGSLGNAAIRLRCRKEYYKIKRNGDIQLLTKLSVNCKIKIRLIQ